MKRRSTHNFVETLKFGRPYLAHLILASFLNLVTVCADLGFLYLLKRLIDTGLAAQNLMHLKWLALAALGLLLVRSGFGYISGFLSTYIDGRMVNDIQDSLYARIQELAMDFHLDNSTGNLLALTFCRTHDMVRVITSLSGTLVKELLRIPALTIFLFSLNTGLSIFAVLVFPPVIFCLRLFRNLITQTTQQTHETLSQLYTTAEQALSHIETVKIFAKETQEAKRFQQLNQELLSHSIQAYKAIGLSTPTVQMFKMLGVTLLVFVGTHKITQGELSIGGFTTFLASAYYLYGGLTSLTSWYVSLISGLISAERVFEVLTVQPAVASPVNGVKVRKFENEILVHNISFNYPATEKSVLHGINLHITKGETLALVGPSGSGKSTLIRLLLRLYDPVEGGIFIDGYKLSDLDLPALRGLFGVAPQESGIFQDSIAKAIAYGRSDASLAEIHEAAYLAGAHQFIAQLPNGYDTPIGERGIKLSGGEKQRLALARAILRTPEILILDEALSSVDAPTEKIILRRISAQRRRQTTILISHRLGSIHHADRIVVIEGGAVAEEGTHQMLMADSNKYRQWFLLQQSESSE